MIRSPRLFCKSHHPVGFVLLALLLTSLPVHAEFRDYWSDEIVFDEHKSEAEQVKPHVFIPSDKIDIQVGKMMENGIAEIENKANVRVTVRVAIEHISKLEISDVLFESVPGFAPDGTVFPSRLALYHFDPKVSVQELTTSFANLRTLHLKGFGYGEMVLMVKLQTQSGQLFYAVKRLKVYD